eukprot:403337463
MMNPVANSYTAERKPSSGLDLSGVQSLSTYLNPEQLSKDASQALGSHDDNGLIYDSESDISHESIAEKKIIKIDKKLSKSKVMDKVEKRRLQNRKSALKCRLRKTHIIKSQEQQINQLNAQVGKMMVERQSLYEEIANLKDKLKDEQLHTAQIMAKGAITPVNTAIHYPQQNQQYYQQPQQAYPMMQSQPYTNTQSGQRFMVQPMIQNMQPQAFYPPVYFKLPTHQQQGQVYAPQYAPAPITTSNM